MAANGDMIAQGILQVLMQTRDEIRANMASKGINASGRTSDALTAEAYGNGLRLYFKAGRVAPDFTLEIGRPKGKVPYEFTDIIVEWSKDKGLNWGDEKSRRKIAGAVAWGKIRRFGTDRHYAPVDVYTTPVHNAVQRIKEIARMSVLHTIKEANTNW